MRENLKPPSGDGSDASTRQAGAQALIGDFLVRNGLAAPDEPFSLTPLTGGVSSDIWRVDIGRRSLCVKRALPRLRVAARWEAPVARNSYEWAWIETAAPICPAAVPKLYARDADAGLFAMEFLEPSRYPLWKALLRDGAVSSETAAEVARRLVAIHAATAGDPAIAQRFQTDEIFYAIRLEPYLVATAEAHPDLARELRSLAAETAATKRALVHGDVSPKNILVGPDGPVFLDAECAWYGDPAFDLAFCLNHLLLKTVWRPAFAGALLAAFRRLASVYLDGVRWEPRAMFDARCARLLPGLLLARIDGKSPVEYLTAEDDKRLLRERARRMLRAPPESLALLASGWSAPLSIGP